MNTPTGIIAASRLKQASPIPVFIDDITTLNVTAFTDTTITINWNIPNSTNPISFYEIWVNGSKLLDTPDNSNTYQITGLTASTNYTIKIKAVDNTSFKSDFSNEVSQTTDAGGGFDFTSDLMGYWKLATNSLDSSGIGHNGTDTDMTYAGGYAKFGTGYISVLDSDDFSFTDGLNDISAHFLISFILNDKTGIQVFIAKRQANIEWQVSGNGTDLGFILYSTTNSDFIRINIPLSLISTGVLNTIQFAYNGNKLHTGLNAYLNGNNQVGTSLTGGSYVGMINTGYNLLLGAYYASSKLKADAKEWAIWKGRTMTLEEITEIDRRVKAGEPLI